MNDNEISKLIRESVFSETGIRLSEQDPVISVILANKMLLNEAGGALHEVVRDIPNAIESSIEKIVLAVEDSERTVGSLRDETKGMLNALAKLEVEETHRRIKNVVSEDISLMVGQSTKALNAAALAAENKIKTLGAGLRDSKLFMANIALSIGLAFTVIIFGVGGVVMYNFAQEAKSASDYWYGRYQQQQEAVDSLPAATKKLIADRIKSKA
ncbi:hypothetical protein [Pseudomonas coronafaciens]|uniref:hypothetical protein n=1 Tax=Pseudomonas coronafaciens TaxID=53409 RepID=UPI0006ABAEE2|nr:hypothetical protein [Pseudomonas coronafaciens]KOP53982.1 hypothetical protein OX88_19555 [Pseudomonas coronafaciens pv. porri]KPY27048.1 Uncharacterized protein ALO89_01320 [Pseudomonas coronafaciens pv. porri]RMW01970.1 hypothetical protein ALP00_101547 [Pseudomonas coronafaciens pv. porri]RMW03965.1 hypothetical protein ALO99_02759 [Pseudomonas coronafaciens pv. porri]